MIRGLEVIMLMLSQNVLMLMTGLFLKLAHPCIYSSTSRNPSFRPVENCSVSRDHHFLFQLKF